MGGIFSAYVTTLGIITYRWWKNAGQLPPPVSYAGATAIFGVLGLVARSENGGKFAGVTSWAVVVGALSAPATQIQAVQGIYGVPSIGSATVKTPASTTSPTLSA